MVAYISAYDLAKEKLNLNIYEYTTVLHIYTG